MGTYFRAANNATRQFLDPADYGWTMKDPRVALELADRVWPDALADIVLLSDTTDAYYLDEEEQRYVEGPGNPLPYPGWKRVAISPSLIRTGACPHVHTNGVDPRAALCECPCVWCSSRRRSFDSCMDRSGSLR